MLDALTGQQDSFRNFLPHLGQTPLPGSSFSSGTVPHFSYNIFKGKEQVSDEIAFVDVPSAYHLMYSAAGEIVSSTVGDKDIQMNIVTNTEASHTGSQETATAQDIETLT
jgi:hypothetical protein